MSNYNVLWFSGRPCSGKSTLANEIEEELLNNEVQSFRLDGDMLRDGLNYDLGFTFEDRKENLRRAAEITRLFKNYNIIVLSSFITPTENDIRLVNNIIGPKFKNIYVKCSLDKCIERDVKGMYKRALNGEIVNFTGLDAPYDDPIDPWITVDTEKYTIDECKNFIFSKLYEEGIL